MKPVLTLLLLWGISAWGQVCTHSTLVRLPPSNPNSSAFPAAFPG